jgi:DUF4097 and DUF4098 domain-containing protein YvlB
MKKLVFTLLVAQIVWSQKIFESFDLESKSRYVGKTTYDFVVDMATTPSIKIHKVQGDITIKGGTGSSVHVEETVRLWSRSRHQAEAQFEDYRATVLQHRKGNVVEILGTGHWPSRIDFSYLIVTPSDISVQAYTNGGDIELRNITGEVDLNTVGGDLNLMNITGKLTAKTSGGDIDLAHGVGTLFLSTSGGDIDIRDTEGRLNVHTSGGDIRIDYNRGDAYASTSGGDIELYAIEGRSVRGQTSGGDIEAEDITADLELETSGGDLEIESVRGNVTVSTRGGDIQLEDIFGFAEAFTSGGSITGSALYGAVNVRTNGGDVEIEKRYQPTLVDHNITIRNSMGDILLVLPAEFPGNFDVEAEGLLPPGAVASEFPLVITKDRHGIRATGKVGAGIYTVKLRTKNGEIVIEKD